MERPHIHSLGDLRTYAALGLPSVSLVDGEVADLSRDWKHRWLHTYNAWGPFAVWEEARWPDDVEDDEEAAAACALVGRWPDAEPVNMPKVWAYANDPALKALMAMREPDVLPKYHTPDPGIPF